MAMGAVLPLLARRGIQPSITFFDFEAGGRCAVRRCSPSTRSGNNRGGGAGSAHLLPPMTRVFRCAGRSCAESKRGPAATRETRRGPPLVHAPTSGRPGSLPETPGVSSVLRVRLRAVRDVGLITRRAQSTGAPRNMLEAATAGILSQGVPGGAALQSVSRGLPRHCDFVFCFSRLLLICFRCF